MATPLPAQLFDVVDEDLNRSSTTHVVKAAEASAKEILRVVKPCGTATCVASS